MANNTSVENKHIVFGVMNIFLATFAVGSNIIVIAGYFFTRRFDTVVSKCYVPCLALSDLCTGVFTMPLLVMKDIGSQSVRLFFKNNFYGCAYTNILKVIPTRVAFHLLFMITADRSLAINFPLWYIKQVGKKQIYTALLILLIYDFSTMMCMIFLFRFTPGTVCTVTKTYPFRMDQFIMLDGIVLLVVGLFCGIQSIFLIYRIRRKMRKNSMSLKSLTSGQANNISLAVSKKSSPHMKPFTLLMFLYIFLYAPTAFMYNLDKGSDDNYIPLKVAEICRHLNACVNVFVYSAFKQSNMVVYRFLLTNWPWNWHKVDQEIKDRESRRMSSAKFQTPGNNLKSPEYKRDDAF